MPQLGSVTVTVTVTQSPPPSLPKSTLPAGSPTKSTSEVPHVPPFIAPPGWTTRPGSPRFECEWDGVDSEGQKIARSYGLAPGRPLLEDDDASLTIFQSGDKLYLWLCFI
ncbi:hypothetical protein ACN38_g5654 [Penicillium nordicum]|uniref:Uncharacterized protein n=1 Tax=Penicillium nordicum TaxID=229535 RepID=A0A0M8P9E0_9EURO|nr:hypothetical protein ACN38_g5654 [Penicillium nordicum]